MNLFRQNQRFISIPTLLFSLALAILTGTLPTQAAEKEHNGWIYADNIGGVKLNYPSTWKKTSAPAGEPDNLIKVSGVATSSAGSFGELSLSLSKDEVSPSLFFKIIEESYWSKLTDLKSTKEKSVRVSGAGAALEREITFRQPGQSDQLICQRYLVFQIGKKTYHMIFTCPQSDYAGTGTLWNNFVCSLAPAAAANTTSTAASLNENSYSTWRSHGNEISVSYPSFFKSQSSDDEDHLLKAAGSKDGKFYSLDIFKGDAIPNLNLGQHAAHLEEKYFAPQKNYRKIKDSESNFGNASGILQESTFEANGAKLHHLTGFVFVDNSLWAVAFSTSGVNYNEAHQMWSHIASSISVKK